MVINKGCNVEEGRHEELLAKNGVLSGCMKVSLRGRRKRRSPAFGGNRGGFLGLAFRPSGITGPFSLNLPDLRSSLREFLCRVPPVAGSLGC